MECGGWYILEEFGDHSDWILIITASCVEHNCFCAYAPKLKGVIEIGDQIMLWILLNILGSEFWEKLTQDKEAEFFDCDFRMWENELFKWD